MSASSAPSFTSESEAKAVVDRFYAAFEKGDVAAVLALASEDVIITQSERLPWGGRFVGRAELARFAAVVRSHIASKVTIEHLVAAGPRVAAVGRTQGKVIATGLSFSVPLIHLFTVDAGRLTALEVLVDVPAMLAVLG